MADPRPVHHRHAAKAGSCPPSCSAGWPSSPTASPAPPRRLPPRPRPAAPRRHQPVLDRAARRLGELPDRAGQAPHRRTGHHHHPRALAAAPLRRARLRSPARATAISIDGRDYPISHMWGAVPIHLLGADIDLDRRTKGVAGAATAAPPLDGPGPAQPLRRTPVGHPLERPASAPPPGQHQPHPGRLRRVRPGSHVRRPGLHRLRPACGCSATRAASRRNARAVLAGDMGQPRPTTRACGPSTPCAPGSSRPSPPSAAVSSPTPRNRPSETRLRDGQLTADDYHRQILRLVYRLVFLLVAEDRDLLHPRRSHRPRPATCTPATTPSAGSATRRAVTAAAATATYGNHSNPSSPLWTGEASPRSGYPPSGRSYGLPAAAPTSTPPASPTATSSPPSAISPTPSGTERLHRVDFANLGPEELGSVYESLLELHPRVEADAARFELATAGGSERKTTGSYYTPTPLITLPARHRPRTRPRPRR